jgi:16S rRNA (cytosine967-C5)-methyltransferase
MIVTAGMARRRADHLDRAGALYLAGIRARAPLDVVVARFLRENKGIGDDGRAFVVDTAQGMWRVRRRLEAAIDALGFDPTRGALAALYLVGARGVEAQSLPIDPRGAPDLIAAWQKTESAPLAVRASLPEWLVEKLASDALCLSFTEAPPQSLRVNTLKATRDDVIAALAREGIDTIASTRAPECITVVERTPVFHSRAFHDGLFEVQDEGSQLVSRLCDAKPGQCVVDGCAGAGGKTLHLAALLEGKGEVHAFDVAGHRLAALRERARRAGAHNVRVHDDIRERKKLLERADVVLVDAPCSGTGVLRRNPDTSWKLKIDDVVRLVEQQREILDAYAPLVKPGGRLVYATCSLLDEENAGVVESFLAGHATFARVDELALDPFHDGTDGFRAFALVRH